MRDSETTLQEGIRHLEALGPVRGVVKFVDDARDRDRGVDGSLKLITDTVQPRFNFQIKRGLNASRVQHLITQISSLRRSRTLPLLISDYIAPAFGDRLAAADINYVDAVGNMFLHVPPHLYVHFRGNSPKATDGKKRSRLTQPSGLRILFVLLAQRAAVNLPYRELADLAGVALGSLAEVRQELRGRGFLQQTGKRTWELKTRRELLDLWVAGYGDHLRPTLALGRFVSEEKDPHKAAERFAGLAESLGVRWGYGGVEASYYLLRHFRDDEVVLFASELPSSLLRRLRWMPSTQGRLVFFRAFSPLAIWDEKLRPPVAHPLLIYAELLASHNERARETAKLIYQRFIAPDMEAE